MDIFLPFKIVSFLASAGTVFFALRMLSGAKLKALLTISIAFFFLSTILFSDADTIGEWDKHLLFYAGQLFLFFFMTALVKGKTNVGGGLAGFVLPFSFSDTTRDFFGYITEQGVQHLITIPFAVIAVTTISSRLIVAEAPDTKPAIRFFFLALFSFAMIHTAEFFIESQGFFPFLDGTGVEMMEFLFYYLALLSLSAGLKEMSRGGVYK
ncbi:hypothetical protein A3C91_00200 [Candidatus Azambacteria bacterium RIFCSPHIGHO2_02_FULL_52_12]|uniref:Uncharacterized protein n=1 Tax=Candidatus Azambacteria bacterium RIFCSPLOWO2_01_FULL_46_25 TaxID=1797298 RepID=A0A1F5BUQ1_9BACT|nr:MAG: hypothetical protein A3C91_00200 [Candidatus Azambacteria bacterium RIFCSPHIGHO2_02_FULL_52_12]OGD34311.1 MAG: hypothetical protein A2988_02160 [Candidatus Azambacteria bacterium RIFCSPLOWO2_01_FULL_46_25]OGD37762.1 MAG: hypothetical protein A2850_03425 [Candidatus Azambacteria bacterium RIFCSPHIGHO2_01_FULL_51_74]